MYYEYRMCHFADSWGNSAEWLPLCSKWVERMVIIWPECLRKHLFYWIPRNTLRVRTSLCGNMIVTYWCGPCLLHWAFTPLRNCWRTIWSVKKWESVLLGWSQRSLARELWGRSDERKNRKMGRRRGVRPTNGQAGTAECRREEANCAL